MSREQNNIVIGGEGVCVRCKRDNSESIMFFLNFLKVSEGLSATIVDYKGLNNRFSTIVPLG